MNHNEFLQQIHRRIAIVSVGGSAIRNQGASGMVDDARSYFKDSIALDEFFSAMKDETSYRMFLDKHTIYLRDKFREGGRRWGAARKGLNLFFRDLVYNKFITEEFGLSQDFNLFNDEIKYLEVPLDSFVAQGLCDMPNLQLPKWKSIKELTPGTSELFQISALQVAKELKVARVHLDLILWRQPSE